MILLKKQEEDSMKEKTRTEELTEIRSFWKNQIEGWQESGLPQVEYCRKHNLIPHRFTYWKQKLVKKTTEAPVSLVQVNMKTHFNAGSSYASPLRLGNNRDVYDFMRFS